MNVSSLLECQLNAKIKRFHYNGVISMLPSPSCWPAPHHFMHTLSFPFSQMSSQRLFLHFTNWPKLRQRRKTNLFIFIFIQRGNWEISKKYSKTSNQTNKQTEENSNIEKQNEEIKAGLSKWTSKILRD